MASNAVELIGAMDTRAQQAIRKSHATEHIALATVRQVTHSSATVQMVGSSKYLKGVLAIAGINLVVGQQVLLARAGTAGWFIVGGLAKPTRSEPVGVEDIRYPGNLVKILGGESYEVHAGYGFPEGILTSTSWDGDAKSSTTGTKIDMSAVFGVPAGVHGVWIQLYANHGSAGAYFGVGPCTETQDPNGTSTVQVRETGVDRGNDNTGPVRCDSNGDLYYSTGGIDHAYIWVTGLIP